MVDKYNKLYLLVHPMYELFIVNGFYLQLQLKSNENPIITQIKNKDSTAISILKRIKGVYGDQINKISKDPQAMLIIFEPKIEGYSGYSEKMSYKEYSTRKKKLDQTLKFKKKFLFDFDEFIKKKLEGRVVVSTYNPNKRNLPDEFIFPSFLNKSVISKLSNKVDIFAFGEYRDLCVSSWGKAIKIGLEKHKIETNLNFIEEKTLSAKKSELVGFRKLVLSGHERRTMQKKNQKLKLRFNQGIKREIGHVFK